MKKFITILIAFMLLFSFSVSADTAINVILDGKTLVFDQYPVIMDGRTLVPLRVIFEELGAEVSWDDTTKTAVSSLENTTVKIQINNTDMYINSAVKVLDVPAQLIGGRTLVPARAVAEAFGCNVTWDGENSIVYIKTKNYAERETNFLKYTSEKFSYTISYSDKYTVYTGDSAFEMTGVEQTDFVLVDSASQSSISVISAENIGGIITNSLPNLKEIIEASAGFSVSNYETFTLNGIPAASYSFETEGATAMQIMYFTPKYVYAVTLGLLDTASIDTTLDLAYTLQSLAK